MALRALLDGLCDEQPRIAEVRGLGAMVAVEFRDPADGALRRRLHQARACRPRRCAWPHPAHMRHGRQRAALLFPLTIEDAVFEEALGMLRDALRAAARLDGAAAVRRHGRGRFRAPRASLAAQGVHTLLVQFTDLHGAAKGKLVPLERLEHADGRRRLRGPSIWGTGLPRCGPRAEYHAVGDPAMLRVLPWMGVARIVGDGVVAGAPFEACPRQVLRRDGAARRAWLDPAHRHRAGVLPVAAGRRALRAGRRRGPSRQAELRPEKPAAPAGLPARAARRPGGRRAGRGADRPRGRARPVRAQLRPRRRAAQRRPRHAVQARRAPPGRAARAPCSR